MCDCDQDKRPSRIDYAQIMGEAATDAEWYQCNCDSKRTQLVYICHPLTEDVEGNVEKVKLICKALLQAQRDTWGEDGEIDICPVAPQLMLPYGLDAASKLDNEFALRQCLNLLAACDELWVYGDRCTAGMRAEIEFASENNIPVCWQEPCDE